jgi:tetratricopeptide (TPR) repeat protein
VKAKNKDRLAASVYSGNPLSSVASLTSRFLARSWFGGRFGIEEQLPMARLLVGIWMFYERGLLPSKREASLFMNAVDPRTSQRYIGLAQEHGLLTIVPSQVDKRADLLRPTSDFFALMNDEFSKIADEVLFGAKHLLSMPEPSITYFPGDLVSGDPLELIESIELQREPRRRVRRKPDYLLARYTETIRLAGSNSAAYKHRAYQLESEGKYEEALLDFTEALRIAEAEGKQPDYIAFIYEKRGWILQRLGDREAAISAYRKALELAPDLPFAAESLARLSQPDEGAPI